MPSTIHDYSDVKSFVEVHIEQGKVLETEQKTIGIVEGIVGQKRYTINLKGEANHAGTTPMGLRRDGIRDRINTTKGNHQRIAYLFGTFC